MTDDRTKRTILARRARFVAAALTGLGAAAASMAACGDGVDVPTPTADSATDGATEASVCLSIDAALPDGATDAAVCLTMTPPDADADVAAEATVCLSLPAPDAADAADETDAEPAPCLKIAPDAADDG